jgi:integrase
MARQATGQVIEPDGKQRGWALRFRAYGKRRFVTLGRPEDGWDRGRAEAELRHVLADVERGIWKPHEPVEAPADVPTFHEFASEWYERHEQEWRPLTQADYKWVLTYHLLPFFKDHRLSEITIEEVDRYKAVKQREGVLSNNSINKTLTRLSQVLEEAFEYGKIDRNPARGKRRRLKGEQRSRQWIEPEQLMAPLDAADPYSRPVFATLAGTGMRPGEAVALRWGDVNLATGTISIRQSKTDAGVRQVDLPLGLSEELGELKARSATAGPDDPVFVNSHGRRQIKDNVQRRLKSAIKRANEVLERAGIEPLSASVTPYAFRRTYSSLRAARWIDSDGNVRPGDDPIYIADQMGHTDPAFTFRVYQKAVKRRERLSSAHLQAFDRALEWARMGRTGQNRPADELGHVPNPALPSEIAG